MGNCPSVDWKSDACKCDYAKQDLIISQGDDKKLGCSCEDIQTEEQEQGGDVEKYRIKGFIDTNKPMNKLIIVAVLIVLFLMINRRGNRKFF